MYLSQYFGSLTSYNRTTIYYVLWKYCSKYCFSFSVNFLNWYFVSLCYAMFPKTLPKASNPPWSLLFIICVLFRWSICSVRNILGDPPFVHKLPFRVLCSCCLIFLWSIEFGWLFCYHPCRCFMRLVWPFLFPESSIIHSNQCWTNILILTLHGTSPRTLFW